MTKPRLIPAASLVLLLASTAACDLSIPTSAPMWETTWGIRAKTDSVSLSQFLPADISVSNGAFRTAPPAAQVTVRLADACGGTCAPFAIPKPAFTTKVETSIPVGGDVVRANLGSGNILRAIVQHDFGFDLLAPAGASEAGSLALRVLTRMSATAVWDTVGLTYVTGATAQLPSGGATAFDLPLVGGRAVGGELKLEAMIVSPAGSSVILDGSRSLTVTLDAPRGVGIANATISLPPRTVRGAGAELDLTELDLDTDHLRSASLSLAIDNSLAITGNAALVIERGNAVVLTKPFSIATGASTAKIDFSTDELQLLRGAVNTLALRADVRTTSANNELTVRPTDRIKFETTFIATIRPTGSPSGSR
jgi:hypothetical protein